jgi:polyisoprenoid-binding protein YceI
MNTRPASGTRRLLCIGIAIALAACSPKKPTAADSSAPTAAAAEVPPASTAPIPAGTYTLDKAHSSLLFRLNHLGFSNFTARFKRFDAQLQFDPKNLAAATLTATIDAKSLETDYPDPATLDFNAELLGPQWLDAAQFPEITFKTRTVTASGSNAMRIDGDLTLHGVTHPITLDATFNGGYAGHPMDPHARIGFSAHGSLNRSDFAIAYGIPAPGTTLGVSNKVSVIIESEFTGPPLAGADAANEKLTQ